MSNNEQNHQQQPNQTEQQPLVPERPTRESLVQIVRKGGEVERPSTNDD